MNMKAKHTEDALLGALEGILQKSLDLSARMDFENRVCAAELDERNRLDLHGDEAIDHYNKWMRKYGLDYMAV